MSLWINKKRQNGSSGSDLLLFPIAELMLPAIILLAILITLGLSGALILSCLGFILFLAAKLSLIVNGIYISWGSKSMTPILRVCYRLGYGLMTAGILAALFSLKLGR